MIIEVGGESYELSRTLGDLERVAEAHEDSNLYVLAILLGNEMAFEIKVLAPTWNALLWDHEITAEDVVREWGVDKARLTAFDWLAGALKVPEGKLQAVKMGEATAS